MLGWFRNLLGPGVPSLSPQEAQAKLKSGAILLDVRTPYERKDGKIPGSKALPLAELAKGWESLPKDKEIICQCASGNRSRQAAAFLARKVYTAYNLLGGIEAWKRAGLPLKK